MLKYKFSNSCNFHTFFKCLVMCSFWSLECFFFQKLKQHLQRTKQGSKSSQTYGRQSPLHGDHTAIAASRLPQSIPISIPLAPRQSEGPQKRSLEGLNSEIQKLVLTDTQSDRVSIAITERFLACWLVGSYFFPTLLVTLVKNIIVHNLFNTCEQQ